LLIHSFVSQGIAGIAPFDVGLAAVTAEIGPGAGVIPILDNPFTTIYIIVYIFSKEQSPCSLQNCSSTAEAKP
jgi:hypothetical protein